MLVERLVAVRPPLSFSAATRSAFDVLSFRCPLPDLLPHHRWPASRTCTKRPPRAQRFAQTARTSGVGLNEFVFFRAFFCAAPTTARAHKRVKTSFASGNRIRRRSCLRRRSRLCSWSGRCRWLLLPEHSNGYRHQRNKHKTKSLIHGHTFLKSCQLAGSSRNIPNARHLLYARGFNLFRHIRDAPYAEMRDCEWG